MDKPVEMALKQWLLPEVFHKTGSTSKVICKPLSELALWGAFGIPVTLLVVSHMSYVVFHLIQPGFGL